MKKTLIAIACAITIGCSSFEEAVKTVNQATSVYYYSNGDIVEMVGSVNLSNKDKEIINRSMSKIDKLRGELTEYRDPAKLAKNIINIDILYHQLKTEYLILYRVVGLNFHKYGEVEQYTFKHFHDQVLLLDGLYLSYKEQADKDKALSTTLSILDTGLKIGSMLL